MAKFAKLKFFSLVIFLGILAGCASISIPNYIQDEHPYKKKFYARFDDVLKAASQTLTALGWEVDGTSDPSVFERQRAVADPLEKQVLLFSKLRQTPLFIGSRYARLNLYLQSSPDNTTEVEIRTLTVTTLIFKKFTLYRDDRVAEILFREIEERLNQG